MDAAVQTNTDVAVIRLSGRFDFSAHREFRDAVDSALAQVKGRQVRVDLSGVTYLDSSALGMLLMLRDKARPAERPVALVGAQGSVRQVLEIANFGKLFEIA